MADIPHLTNLKFTQALVLFTTAQTLAFLAMLAISNRENVRPSSLTTLKTSRRLFGVTLVACSTILAAATLTIKGFRESPPYYALMLAVPMLYTLSVMGGEKSKAGPALYALVLWHYSMYMSPLPQADVGVGEGTQMDRAIATLGSWDYRYAHNPSYNPLPTAAFVRVAFASALGLPWYSAAAATLLGMAWWAAYDLTVYMLAYAVTRSRATALIAPLFVAVTPLTPLHQHPYQWSSSMMWLAAYAVAIRSLYEGFKPSHLALVALLSAGAILAHATSLAFIISLTFSLLAFSAFRVAPHLGALSRTEHALVRRGSRVLLNVTAIAVLIFLVRSTLTQGFTEYTAPAFINIGKALIDIIREAFAPAPPTMEKHLPLFERAGVSPLQAYSWSLAISMAVSYVAYTLLARRRAHLLELPLLSSLIVLGAAFVAYGIFREPGAYWLNRTTYVLAPLLFPLAAKALTEVIAKGKQAYAFTALMLLAVAAPIASHDPNISPIQYAVIREIPQIEITQEDLVRAAMTVRLTDALAVNSIHTFSKETFVEKIVYTGRGLQVEYRYTSPIRAALDLYTFLTWRDGLKSQALDPSSYVGDYDLVLNFGDEGVVRGT